MVTISFKEMPDREFLKYMLNHGGRILVPEEQSTQPHTIGRDRVRIRLNTHATVNAAIKRLYEHKNLEIYIRGDTKDTYPRMFIVKDDFQVRVAQSNGRKPLFKVKEYELSAFITHLQSRHREGVRVGLHNVLNSTDAEEVQGLDEICRMLDILPASL